ncbi:M48 family metallopeptidase [Ferruginibacter sp. HRS2-29]|uniref:tetratricopeptide repeat protein n=1 Tax=Ferruginibacter sp. HRS2-29 TaxID=2487334 RepID=UPI0020CF04C5|nr:hypothetical protein [Ferruginibacter sp. HRS2-29]MCP9752816.1 hypothetical protein [Ferruginibacter sp. HRS2-29]
MKYLFALLLLSFCAAKTIAQQKPKQKAPVKKEMNKMLEDAQKMMDDMMKEMDPEDKKFMDSMGMKVPGVKKADKALQGISDKQLAKAWGDDTRMVPKKDAARIAAIAPGVPDSRLLTYIAAIQKKLMGAVNPELVKAGDKVYEYIRLNTKNSSEAGNIAAGFWIAGKPQLALYILGKVCVDDPKQTDNISNYASMLSMQGGQHLAIPVLNNLNAKFPKNSTVLNNLGQAWFGLGDIDKASKYLDSAIALYPFHAQANLTKGLIKESKGDKAGAVENVKRSIRHSFTDEKEGKLKQLGYKTQLKDVRLPFNPPADPLGLEKTERPEYPMSVSQINALLPYWQQFNADCDAQIEQLQKQAKELNEKYASSLDKLMAQGAAAMHGGAIPTVSVPVFAKKAGLAMEERRRYHEIRIKKLLDEFKKLQDDLTEIRKNNLNAAAEEPCSVQRDAVNRRLKKLNERRKKFDVQELEVFRHMYNDLAYYARYTSTDDLMFNMIVIPYKIDWLRKNRELQPLEMDYAGTFSDCVEEDKGKRGKLADFDDVACKIRDTTNLGVWQFVTTCTKLISKLNLKVIEYTRYENFERAEGDEYVESTLKIAIEKGDGLHKGPLKAEAKIGAAIEFEFDRGGVKDVIASVEGKVGIGHNVLDEGLEAGGNLGGKDVWDTTVEIGVEGKIGLISGRGSIGGTGKLEGIKLLEW